MIGGYDRIDKLYYPRPQGMDWQPACVPPAPIPSYLRDWPVGGVVATKLTGTGYKICGKECTKEEAYALLQRTAVGQLPDDSGKLRLTIIGTEAECSTVLNDLKTDPKLSAIATGLTVLNYRPDHWHVDGIFERGNPSIYYQMPSGKVLARLTKYPGAKQFEEMLRKRDPDYNPAKDPGLPKAPPPPPKDKEVNPSDSSPIMKPPDPLTSAGIGAGIIAFLTLLLRRPK